MHSDRYNSFVAFHENVFGDLNSHIAIYLNTQNSNFSTHWHTPLEIIMPKEENYTVFVNNTEYNLQPDDILLIAPNTYHSLIAPPTGSRYLYLIDLSVLKDIHGFSQISSLVSPSILITPSEYPDVQPRLKELLLEMYDAFNSQDSILLPSSATASQDTTNNMVDFSETIIYSRILEIFILIAQHFKKTTTRNPEAFAKNKKLEYLNRFTMICNYIDTHCYEPLSLEHISELASFSKFHFSRLFKEFTGEPFYRYVNRKRIEYACSLLKHQNMTITEIALASGYSSNSVFIRMFKQFRGCTPKEYRTNTRKE